MPVTMNDQSGMRGAFNNGMNFAELPNDDLYSSVYAFDDDERKKPRLRESLKSSSLEAYLCSDVIQGKDEEKELLWYHGRITRDVALHFLQENGSTEGLFLVRESTSRNGDYVISLIHNGCPAHFQIQCLGDFYFRIENGPLFQGLDQLVNYYQTSADGLPTQLKAFCAGDLPPSTARRAGRTTPLHRAAMEGDKDILSKILEYDESLRGHIDSRNAMGQTALHEASARGFLSIINLLLDNDANINCKNSSGVSPLYVSCSTKHPESCQLLMKKNADPTQRHPRTGWVPLHEAVTRGYIQCAKHLIMAGAPCHPRNSSNETPMELARRYNQPSLVSLLKNFLPPAPQIPVSGYYHGPLDRSQALERIQAHGLADGVFLVRTSPHKPRVYVLSMAASASVYNFEIQTKSENLYIDDGPYFTALEMLIEHYMKYEDGLPTKLTQPIRKPSSEHDNNAGPNSRPSHRNPPSDGVRAPSCVKPPPLRSPPPTTGRKAMQPQSAVPAAQKYPPPPPRVQSVEDQERPSSPTTTQGPRAFSRILSSIRGNEKKEMDRQRRELQKAIQNVPGGGCTEDLQVIDAKQISKGKELGQGEFGTVLEGTWRDSRGHKHSVALKTLLTDHMHTSQQNEFLREAKVMCSLNHKCIVRLLGVCVGPPMMLVQELVGMGSLLEHLLNHPSEIPEGDLRLWAAQITSGMMYLEEKKFVHRDLAARNILLESNEQAKISDFGLSRATGANNDYYRATTGGRWPVKWYAPESIYYGTFSHSSDVWSFGVTLWEMFTYGDQPYGELTGAEVIKRIEAGKRLEKPKAAKETDYEMMMECWSYKAEDRPTFYQLNLSLSKEELYQGFYHAGFGQAPSKRKK